MKFLIAFGLLAGSVFLATSSSVSAAAAAASQREYKRGYADCAAGRWDEKQHGASYKKGCRAAEDKKGAAATPECPADVSEANRYQYPGCR